MDPPGLDAELEPPAAGRWTAPGLQADAVRVHPHPTVDVAVGEGAVDHLDLADSEPHGFGRVPPLPNLRPPRAGFVTEIQIHSPEADPFDHQVAQQERCEICLQERGSGRPQVEFGDPGPMGDPDPAELQARAGQGPQPEATDLHIPPETVLAELLESMEGALQVHGRGDSVLNHEMDRRQQRGEEKPTGQEPGGPAADAPLDPMVRSRARCANSARHLSSRCPRCFV